MMKKIPILFYLSFISSWVYSQNPPNLDEQLGKLTVPSATAASLLRFNEVPVNLYTGTPDISVPIYTVKTGTITLPITLRYSASGIRVGENASNVGLGWTLVAEGIIQETVLGIPDNNTYHQNGLGWDNSSLVSTDPADQALLESLSTGGQDGAPDLYTFNFGGYSGKFIYADVIRTLPQQNLSISTYLNTDNLPEWKIVTQDGTQYIFGKMEKIANRSSEAITRSRAWYLTRIVDANNTDSITFAYEPTVTTEVIGRSFSFYTWRPEAPSPLPFDKDMNPNDPAITGTYNQVEQTSHGWQLKTISWDQGSIEYDFVTGDREDMTTGSPRIRNIFLKNKEGQLLRVVHLGQSYFQTPGVNDLMGKRLKLDAVTFAPDLNSLSSPSAHQYSFEYNPLPLPGKLSNQIDHWGFYNGAVSNASRGLIPSFSYPGMNYYGADRNANPYYTQAAMLIKMHYPTGGYAAFEWEAHAKTYPTQLLDSVIVYHDTLIEFEMACEGNEELTGEWEEHLTIPTTPSDLFANGVEATWYCAMSIAGPNYPPETINHADGMGWLNERPIGVPYTTPPTVKASKSFSWLQSGAYYHSQNVTLLPGKYYSLKGHIHSPGYSIEVSLKAKWPRKVINTYTPPSDYLGGCRIRSIVLYDTFTHKTIVKNYDYSLPSFIATPQYHEPLTKYFFYNNGNPPSGNASDCGYYIPVEGMYVSSNSVHNFNAGVQAGYDWVKETIGNGTEGSTVYKYTNFSELTNHGEIPASWRYGRLREVSQFNNLGIEVRKTAYSNQTVLESTENFAGHTAVRTGAHPCHSPGGTYPVHFNQKVYSFPCDWIFTDSIKTVDYTTGLQTVTVNNFDNPQHREVTRSTTFLSDGSKQSTFFKYPTDFAVAGSTMGEAAGVARLQERHIHNMPVEAYTQKWLPGSGTPLTIAASYNQYKLAANGAAILNTTQRLALTQPVTDFQPTVGSTNAITRDARYQAKATVFETDLRNNVLTLVTEGNKKAGYIWGHDGTAIIATVANDSFSRKRGFTSFEKDASGNWAYNEAGVITTDHVTGKRAFDLSNAGGPLGIEVPAAPAVPIIPHQPLPGAYIVSYWKKNGAVSVDGTAPTFTGMTANGWTYCEHLLTTPMNYIEITGTALIDELRFYPQNAQMESFTYDPLIGITSRDDAGSHIILYEYDAMGRLSLEKDVFGNILKKHTYQYFGDQ